MSRPLESADPPQLGPFRLTARLRESPAGIVYLGEDPYGIRVSVAVLTRGAAGDAAARERFQAAIIEELPAGPARPLVRPRPVAPTGSTAWGARPPAPEASRPTPERPTPDLSTRSDRADPGTSESPASSMPDAPLIAAHPNSPAPWVATMHDPHRPGAERFLRPVLFGREGRTGGRRIGRRGVEPRFEPYWIGSRDPAAPPVPVFAGRNDRGLIMAIVTLAILLALLALAVALLFGCQPAQPRPVPTPVPSTGSTSPSPAPTPTPSSPRPSPSGTRPTPSPSGSGPGGAV
jgi:hypothetical protein